MKPQFFLFFLFMLTACSIDNEEISTPKIRISTRTLPDFIIPYQSSSGDILTRTSTNLTSWSNGLTASTTPSLHGTSSTIYNYSVEDDDRRCIAIFQNSDLDLKWVEYQDGYSFWSSPASVSTASSALLPSIELVDGSVWSVHVANVLSGEVRGSNKFGSTWTTPAALYRDVSGGFPAAIVSDYSPTVEYHASAGVEFLATAYHDMEFTGYGIPQIYWRYTTTNYNSTTAPNVALGASHAEYNQSITPIAVEQNGNDKLYLFYTIPGTSTASENTIRYVVGDVAGSGSGACSNWSSSSTVSSSAVTTHKIDGLFIESSDRLVIVYRNSSTGAVDAAYTDNFGSSWSLVAGISNTTAAPSISNLE